MQKYDGYALITGGASGIGLEFANQLAAKGYSLVLVDKDEEKLKAVVTTLKEEYPVEIVPICQDLANPESTDLIYNLLQQNKIQIGLLINNAGFATMDYFHKMDRKYQLDQIKVMCLGLTDLTYKFLPEMLEKHSGGIIFISSISSLMTSPLITVYSAVKAYSLKFGVNLHAEYSSKGIDILTVCPAFVDTNIYAAGKVKKPNVPMLTPEEVVRKSLNALGKEIVLMILNKEMKQQILRFILKYIPLKMLEKLVKREIKDRYNIQL